MYKSLLNKKTCFYTESSMKKTQGLTWEANSLQTHINWATLWCMWEIPELHTLFSFCLGAKIHGNWHSNEIQAWASDSGGSWTTNCFVVLYGSLCSAAGSSGEQHSLPAGRPPHGLGWASTFGVWPRTRKWEKEKNRSLCKVRMRTGRLLLSFAAWGHQ